MKFHVLTKEWPLALATALLLLLAAIESPLIARIDGWLYNIGQHLVRAPQKPLDRVAIIHLDPESLSTLGGESMERHALAQLLERMADAKAAAIGILTPLTKVQSPAGLDSLERIRTSLDSLSLPATAARQVDSVLNKEHKLLDIDSRLETTIKRFDRLVLPWQSGQPLSREHPLHLPDPAYEQGAGISLLTAIFSPVQAIPFSSAAESEAPLDRFASAAQLGWLAPSFDNDKRLRGFELLHRSGEMFAPSFALRLAAVASGANRRLTVDANGITFGERYLQTGPELKAYLNLYPQMENASVTTYSLAEVLDKKFGLKAFADRVVIIASDSLMDRSIQATGGKQLSPAELVAYSTSNLLNGDLTLRSRNILLGETSLFIAALLLLMAISRLRFAFAVVLTVITLLAFVSATEYLLLTQQLWLKSGLPVLLLIAGTAVIGLRRLYSHQNVRHHHSIAAAHRQLGLAMQEQGKIELAFESFQKLPADESSLELIYNLALDFERKRRYERAVSIYDYILHLRPGFKDTAKRRIQAEQMAHSLGANSSQSTSAFLLMPDADGQKPHLGRYEVEKEIGRGAMGAVYLGRDPKIDRIVAIKTLALAQEFESDELKEVEERFFHEAAAAGRMNHPNIVTIYDAGEEHDLAYIAMEYLEGRPLSGFTAKNRLLPVTTVLEIMAQVADALDYASKQGVIHRDIKPANIMFDEKNGNIKIADFGIARITSSSHTRTGVILGTPAYMSPEQISCQKVDGRSDIFSLGATMFTLLTGRKAFDADSIAALSYKITSEKHPDPLKVRPELPACVKSLIDKALHKEIDKRYQSGAAMKRAIHRCLKSIS